MYENLESNTNTHNFTQLERKRPSVCGFSVLLTQNPAQHISINAIVCLLRHFVSRVQHRPRQRGIGWGCGEWFIRSPPPPRPPTSNVYSKDHQDFVAERSSSRCTKRKLNLGTAWECEMWMQFVCKFALVFGEMCFVIPRECKQWVFWEGKKILWATLPIFTNRTLQINFSLNTLSALRVCAVCFVIHNLKVGTSFSSLDRERARERAGESLTSLHFPYARNVWNRNYVCLCVWVCVAPRLDEVSSRGRAIRKWWKLQPLLGVERMFADLALSHPPFSFCHYQGECYIR